MPKIDIGFDWFGPLGYIPNGVDIAIAHTASMPKEEIVWNDPGNSSFAKFGYLYVPSVYRGEYSMRPLPVSKLVNRKEPWYYPVVPVGYFGNWIYDYYSKQLDEKSFLPLMHPSVVQAIAQKHGWFLLFQPEEGPPGNAELFQFFHNFVTRYGLPPEKFVWVTGNLFASDLYNEWCQTAEIQRRIHIFQFEYYEPLMTHRFREMLAQKGRVLSEEEFLSLRYKVRSKAFLCYNRRPHDHRLLTVLYLLKHDLLRLGFISFPTPATWVETDFPNSLNMPGCDDEVERQSYLGLYDTLMKQLPLLVDKPDLGMLLGFAGEVSWPYARSYFSLVTETTMAELTQISSEKIWRPIMNYQPFVLVGSQYTMRMLRRLGYRTFDFDESYDDEPNPWRRTIMALDAARKVIRMTQAQQHQWYWAQEEILVHNRNLLLSRPTGYSYEVLHKDLYDLLHFG